MKKKCKLIIQATLIKNRFYFGINTSFVLFLEKTKELINKLVAILNKFRMQIKASSVLFGINSLVKYLLFEFVYEGSNESLIKIYISMLIYSIFIRYILIIIYDYTKKDWFLLELFKEIRSEEMETQNKLIRKLINLKASGSFFLFLGLAFIDPIFMVIYYREGYKRWNKIPSFKIFLYFLFSCSLCTMVLLLTFMGIMALLETAMIIYFLKIFYILKLVHIL